jgi:sugar/nucleoside kinase (ribokinase family)
LTQFLSRKPGDGGITPGGLVFTEDLENFSKSDIDAIVKTITGGIHQDTVNLGGPAIAALVNSAQLCFDQEIDIVFCAQCGSDDIGDKILSLLEPISITTDYYKQVPGQSPYTIVLSDPRYNKGCGERAFINQLGVAADFRAQITTKDVGELNLLNACAWGISSGGFACFYAGGVYHEATPGEKHHLIKPYVDQYLQQIKVLFSQGS